MYLEILSIILNLFHIFYVGLSININVFLIKKKKYDIIKDSLVKVKLKSRRPHKWIYYRLKP